jgi:hypothetical protein
VKRTHEDTIRPILNKDTGTLDGFQVSPEAARRNRINRRAFLRGAGTVAIGLPFLEGLQERSAWAQSAPPVFTFLMVGSGGVVHNKFFPSATGALTTTGLAGMADKATSVLAPHAANLLFIKNINFPQGGVKQCGHAEGLVQSLTAMLPGQSGNAAYAGGPSADVVIAKAVNPNAADPMTLYAASKSGYITDRISFKAGGAGQVRAGDQNPYTLYSKIVGLTTTTPGTPTVDPIAAELASTRKSVNDLVRAELNSLMGNSALSSADKLRLKQHFDSIREVENTMGTMGAMCTKAGLSTTPLDALKSGIMFKNDGKCAAGAVAPCDVESVVKLHMEVVALAFACNYNRVAALQWGDGTDGNIYKVASNPGLWTFHQLSHRVKSDSATGNDPTAEAAHAEVDKVRMQTLLYGLDQFKARGLQDKAMVVWMTHISDGPSHNTRNVPHIVWGNGGGYLKQGQYIDVGSNITNNKFFNTVIKAAIRDKSTAEVNFGAGMGTGELTAIKA